MNFFERQDKARRSTRRLVLLFIAAVAMIILVVNAVVFTTVMAARTDAEGAPLLADPSAAFDPWMALWVSVAVVAVISLATLYRVASLREGGAAVARSLGATAVPTDVVDPDRRRLRNVVEEVALASGVPVPDIYVLEKEPGINAFAAGYSATDAAVAVSRGCLEQLTREELQGVIAHEFSHIHNGDMRLNIRLVGVLFGILVIGLLGRQLLHAGRFSSRKEGMPILLVALALTITGYVGLFFGQIIKAAVSRQREYLADASAVQFTRNPHGIAGALKKIAGMGERSQGSRLQATDGEEVSHMLFSDGVGYRLFATHPPLDKRIAALDPYFEAGNLPGPAPGPGGMGAADGIAGLAGTASVQGLTGTGETAVPIEAAEVIDNMGNPGIEHVAYAGALRRSLPEPLVSAVHSMEDSLHVVLAMLLDGGDKVRDRQLQQISQRLGEQAADRARAYQPEVQALTPYQMLPMMEMAFPALKRRPREEISACIETVHHLIAADGEITVFEYALARLIEAYLSDAMHPSDIDTRSEKLYTLSAECADLFSVLATFGHSSEVASRHAYVAGMNRLFPMGIPNYAVPEDWVACLDKAIERLQHLAPLAKEHLIEALIETMAHDGRVTVAEAELLRTICASLHCPLPPLLGSALERTFQQQAAVD